MLANYILILAHSGVRAGADRNLKWRDIREISGAKGCNQSAEIAWHVNGKTGPREVVARTSDVKISFRRILELRTTEAGEKPKNEDIGWLME
jgi:hypothetical protein